jgi:hypothetical protein
MCPINGNCPEANRIFGEALDVGPNYVQLPESIRMSLPHGVPILAGPPQADEY